MNRILISFLAGLIFSVGLIVSRMIDPSVVRAFLDFAAFRQGGWDPRLAFVMASALTVAGLGHRMIILRRRKPLFAPAFSFPQSRAIDRRLLSGAAIFGLGWGLVGYCPGPVVAGLSFGGRSTWLFLIAMFVGMLLHQFYSAQSVGTKVGTSGGRPCRGAPHAPG